MFKIYTHFQTKTAQKPYPLGLHIPIYLEEYPPPRAVNIDFLLWMSLDDERRWSVMVFRSGVFNLFIELKLCSAAHADTGYATSVFTAT